jgi:transcriptional regulator with XRE-family HTH domain
MATLISDKFEALGLTDAAISERVGCERSLITKIKLGTARPSPEMAKRIADATGIPLEDLRPDLASIFGSPSKASAA